MSSFLNKITKKDLLTYFEVDEQLLSKDVIDFLDKLFPIEYNELNFEEYQEYMTLVLQILNKLSFDIDFDRNWIVILQNIVDKQKKDVVNSLKPTWFRNDKFYVIDKKFCTTNTEVLDWKYQLAVRNIIFSNQNSPYVITSNNFNSPNAYTFNPNAITSQRLSLKVVIVVI